MLFSKTNAYIGIILTTLSVTCLVDQTVSLPLADEKYNEIRDDNRDSGSDSPNNCDDCRNGDCKECGPTPYESASQIALTIALTIGAIILLVVLWKMCVNPKILHYPRWARERIFGEGVRRSDDDMHGSQSTIQASIENRLQNRPPRYETSYNYNQRIEAAKQRTIIDEAPPAYDIADVEKGPPPPYTIAVDVIHTDEVVDNNNFVASEPAAENIISTVTTTITKNSTNLSSENTSENSRAEIINCEAVHI